MTLSIQRIFPKFKEIVKTKYNISNDELFNMIPKEINEGFCDAFSEAISEIYGGVIEGSDDVAHSYVQLNGKYYDAEALNGVNEPEELPYFKRYFLMKKLQEKLRKLTGKSFILVK
jgi:hypothetical protein